MLYQTFPPSEKLKPYVRLFWVLESDLVTDNSYTHRSMASCCPEMVFHYKGVFDELDSDENNNGLSMISAQSNRYRRFVTMERFGIFGIYLYPFAIPQLFGVSAEETSSLMIGLETLLGAEGRFLEEQVMLAENNQQRLSILTAFLEKRLPETTKYQHPVSEAIKYVVHSKENTSVEDLAYRFNLSQRQFERKFKEQAGFTPKRCIKISRFQSALRAYPNVEKKSLTEIAYDCGYYDQSHFIHDFKAFSGYQPKQYFSGNFEGHEYLDTWQVHC